MHHPIELSKDKLTRIYLVNMLEFDPINNFHLHANMFNYYPSGTSQTPTELNDIITMSQGERGILEFKYKYPGNYMFHAHKTEFAEKGWMGMFKVVDNRQDDRNGANMTMNSAESPNNVSAIKNQTNLLLDSIHNDGKRPDFKNNEMIYNLGLYKVSNNLLHTSQNHTNQPNDIVPSHQYGTNSSQGATR